MVTFCCLPDGASLEHLRSQAKELQRRARASDAEAVALVAALHPRRPSPDALRRSDAQLVVARRYGFASWPRLVQHLETIALLRRTPHRSPVGAPITDTAGLSDEFLRLACLTYGADDPARLVQTRALLAANPRLGSATIHTAAAVGDVAATSELLRADATLAGALGGPHRWEPLLYLTYSRVDGGGSGHDPPRVAELLLAHGADPNAGYLWEGLVPPFTALTGAFGGGEDAANQPPHRQADALARLLLEHGANPNDAQTLYNRQFGASDDHLELLFAFGLGRGDGDPWQHRLDGRIATPRQMLEDQLVAAAAHDYPSRVRLLLSHGVAADGVGTRHPIFHARRAIEIATRNGATGIVELLRDAGADPVTLDPVDELLAACMRADHAATAATDRAIVEQAIERDPGRIVEAAELGRHDTIRLLVDLGWDINARTRRTALHEAAYRGERALVDLLLSLGASPTIRDTSFNVTAAGWAEHNHHLELANYLTEREAGHR